MAQPLLDAASSRRAGPGGGEEWLPLADCAERVPQALMPWLAEPGLLTSRVREQGGAAVRLRLLRMEPAAFRAGGIAYLAVGLVRLVSMFVDRSVMQSNWVSLAFEIVFGVILVL